MTTSIFIARPIISTAITSRSTNAYLLNALLKVKDSVEQDLRATTATWLRRHPTFRVYVRYAGGAARVIGGTDGDTIDNKVWNWLDEGTTVRHAVMTNPFRPKTRYYHIGSMAGVGRLRFVSRKINRPGIDAREWSYAIMEKNEELLFNEVIDAIDKSILTGKGPFR